MIQQSSLITNVFLISSEPSASLPEYGLIELQGDIKHRFDDEIPLNDLHLGDLHFTKEASFP